MPGPHRDAYAPMSAWSLTRTPSSLPSSVAATSMSWMTPRPWTVVR